MLLELLHIPVSDTKLQRFCGVCRGRWDVIDSQVKQREHKLWEEMQEWMQRTQEELSAEYEARYLEAIKSTLAAGEDTSAGANSAALLPEIV